MRLKYFFPILLFGIFAFFRYYQQKAYSHVPKLKGSCKTTRYQSKSQAIRLIELFTSEGCSSCPPADSWLSSSYGHKKLWKTFIPIKFHVDYWNYLGWEDRLSDERFTKRQRRYARQWSHGRVYTPAFLLDGKEWFSLRRKIPTELGVDIGILTVEWVKGKSYQATFEPTLKSLKRQLNLKVSILGNGLVHKIKSGENRGRTLNHHLTALSYQSVTLEKKEGAYKAVFQLKKPKIKAPEYSLVAWVEGKEKLGHLQAVGGCLSL